jgi:hypothetical protein
MKLTVLMLAAFAVWAPSARAESVVSAADREMIRGIPDRWGLTLGSFWQTFETSVRLDGETATGTDINLERDLGLDRNATSLGLSGFYRFADRHRLDLAYVPWTREHTTTIDRQIEWGDVVYDAGATITSKAKSQMLNAIYKYSFFNNGRVVFGLNVGISSVWKYYSLSGEGTISGGTGVSGTIAERRDVVFPIPVIGLHLETTLIKKLFWRLEDNFFAANVSGYRSNVNEFSTSFVYFPVKHFGLGAGFSSTMSSLESNGPNGGNYRIREGFSGVTASLQFPF